MHIEKNFPDVLKKAYVTPIYKKGDPLEAENYRPILVTSILVKKFERRFKHVKISTNARTC